MNDDAMREIVQEFLVETSENLDQLDQDLVALEGNPRSRELLSSIFRTIHTVKGTTGFLGFGQLEHLSHAAESLLSELRDGRLDLTPPRTNILLEVVDSIRVMLTAIEATGEDGTNDYAELIARIEVLQSDPPEASAAIDLVTPVVADVPAKVVVPDKPIVAAPRAEPDDSVELVIAGRPPIKIPRAPKKVAAVPPAAIAEAAPVAVVVEPEAETPVVVSEAAAAVAAPIAADLPAIGAPEPAPVESHRSATERTVRVDVELLDAMMSQVGELVLARNQVSAHVALIDNQALHQTVQRLSVIVSELQEGIMKTRMQAIDQIWSKLPRVVRDLGLQFEKKVVLEMEGGDTELDRSLLEAVKDPLTHLVRNAIDHAIELPEVRVAAGKPETGTLSLRAFHEGGQVVLEVIDDGAGIDPAKIGDRALERGIVSAAQLDALSEREVVELIFRPGFSMATTVTNVSGRGVGMDVVRTNVERIGGTVDLMSTPGEGTTFRIKIPLTLAIIPALLVGCRGQRYAISQANLVEMVQLRTDGSRSEIERIGDAIVYRLRGKLLPIVRLDDVLGYAPVEADEAESAMSIVVVQADGLLLGAVVDEVFGTEEIVVKPLGHHIKQVPLYAGATILGDGSVALILDVVGLAALAHVEEVVASIGNKNEVAEDVGERGERSTFVLLRVGESRRVAVPLKAVSRLEEAPGDKVEPAGAGYVMQYRGALLPLVALSSILDGSDQTDTLAEIQQRGGSVPVVVYSDGERNLGLVASEILDIVEGFFEIHEASSAPGIFGSTVVHGHVTDVLDIEAAFDLSMKEPGHVH